MRARSRLCTALLVLCSLLACEGPVGPEGPAGAQGPVGASGPGTRLVFSGTLDSSGAGGVIVPLAAGTVNDPPAISCYISDDGDTWLIVATDTSAGLACGFSESGGGIAVVIVGAPAFWLYRIVVVY